MDARLHDHGEWTHGHVFLGAGHEHAEARTRLVAIVTFVFMIVEIVCGLLFGSMALLADGVHMATHVGALSLAALAYWLARRHSGDAKFSFGSGKFGDLAAFSSAIVLGIISLAVAVGSVRRLVEPVPVHYLEALVIAVIGLLVNVLSALMLQDDQGHEHEHEHAHDHGHHGAHRDNNLRAAYVHVLADAATSVAAIVALGAGLFFGAAWLDPIVGVLGAVVIGSWSYGLLRDAGMVLLDAEDDPKLARAIRNALTEEGVRIGDMHLWRLGPGHRGLILSLLSSRETSAEAIKKNLRTRFPHLSHVTVEVTVCAECSGK